MARETIVFLNTMGSLNTFVFKRLSFILCPMFQTISIIFTPSRCKYVKFFPTWHTCTRLKPLHIFTYPEGRVTRKITLRVRPPSRSVKISVPDLNAEWAATEKEPEYSGIKMQRWLIYSDQSDDLTAIIISDLISLSHCQVHQDTHHDYS